MKQTNKLARIKLALTTESLKVLSGEQLANVAGGRPNDTLSCVNLCYTINACPSKPCGSGAGCNG